VTLVARSLLIFSLTVCCARETTAPSLRDQIPPQPHAAIRIEKTELAAATAVDPYRWMEDVEARELQAWASAQNAHTRATLDRLELRGKLLARIQALSAARDEANSIKARLDKQFYLKRPAAANTFKLYVRTRDGGKERMLFDPTTTLPGGSASIDFYEPSPDGRRVAFGVSINGSEDAVLRILDVDDGKLLSDTIDRARHAEPRWLPDGTSFFYRRNPRVASGAPTAAHYQGSRDYVHVLGRDPDQDIAVFGYNVSPLAPLAPADSPYLLLWPGCPYAFGLVQHGTSNDLTVYVAALASVDGDRTPWRKLVDLEDQILDMAVHGSEVFLLTHRGAPRAKVIRTRLEAPDLAHADTILAASEIVAGELAAASDALYVRTLDGGIGRIVRIPYDGGAPRSLTLPFDGSIADLASSQAAPGFAFQLQSWTRPRSHYSYDPVQDRFTELGLISPAQLRPPPLESIETKVKSVDGTLVPLSIVSVRGLDRKRPRPTLLVGYGSYGLSINPSFDPRRLAWLENGGIYAVAHVRGGGEYGEEWHLAGMKQHKQHTIDDFIACAQFLVEQGYTSSALLAGEGTSAGGLTIGSAITQQPELFAAAVVKVGIVDAMRFELTALGPQNSAEFGSTTVPEEVKPLYDMSPYYHVSDGACYPAVLLTAAAHDARVPIWQPAKMAARLQHATASGKPILFRLESGAGHGYGLGTTSSQLNEELADCYAFLFWQLTNDPVRSHDKAARCATSKS
jgi:prolyl oligopeptidase